jgi:hypothetical protein
MIGKSNAVLLALLLALPTAYVATAFLAPTVAEPDLSAWLKIVTASWDGAPYPGFVTRVRPVGTGFADRYNVTGLNVCVELYRLKPVGFDGPISAGSPNGTGFIRVSWPDSWENVTIVVKAKSYQGECIGAGNPYSGIIVYWLTINPVGSWWARYSFLGGAASDGSNATVNDDGLVDWWTSWVDMQTNPGRAGLKSGPFDIIDYDTSKNPKGFEPKWFAGNFSDPRNAWVAHAAKIFKVFHEHTWYSIKDNLSYAMVFIYDLDHTPAGSESSLLEACITSGTGDGQCRYNREIYPPQALNYRGFQDNTLVPIPLQIMNLRNQTPFHGGIGAPETNIRIGAPHLNATKRVYWETVLVNQTLYAGREYNGTGTWPRADPADPGFKRRPDFGAYPTATTATGAYLYPAITQGGIKGVPAGPLSIAHNNTITTSTSGNSYRFAAATELDYTGLRDG